MSGSLFADHFPLLVLLATLVSAFFALLWKESSRECWRFFGKLWLGLVGGSVALAWLLYLLPPR